VVSPNFKNPGDSMDKKSAIVVGAGILGLAVARALALKGFNVRVFDKSSKAEGASVRNFGMVWPIGQPYGKLYARAIRSAEIWKEVCSVSGIWVDPVGSLHLAYYPDEWQVLQECYEAFHKEGRGVKLLNRNEIAKQSPGTVQENLMGGLYSSEELIVDPRKAIGNLPQYLQENFGVEFYWGKTVKEVHSHSVYLGDKSEHKADCIFICSGADLETLFADSFAGKPFVKCKLQMMRMGAQPESWRIGPALCGGLSLIHYQSFKVANSLEGLRKRYQDEMKNYLDWGIHVMVSQNQQGELTIGDSHEYGAAIEPFDKLAINNLILEYLKKIFRCRNENIIETWNGIYAKLADGSTEFVSSPVSAVYLVNGVGGAGMTLSFGLGEEVVNSL
jgi:FAD dependent oxidoreductase TIGR03364